MNDKDKTPQTRFTQEEMLTLQALHTRYQRDHDRFSARERARLQFLLWLYEAGRLDSRPGSRTADEDARPEDWPRESTDSEWHDSEDRMPPE